MLESLVGSESWPTTGFYRNKARSVIACSQKLVADFHGEIPHTLEALTMLPGVGRKTANMVLGNAFGVPAIAVDTHVPRVSNPPGARPFRRSRAGDGRGFSPDG